MPNELSNPAEDEQPKSYLCRIRVIVHKGGGAEKHERHLWEVQKLSRVDQKR